MRVYDIPADDPIIAQVAKKIRNWHVALRDYEWEEVNRRGWTVEIDGSKKRVVLDHAELYEARSRARGF